MRRLSWLVVLALLSAPALAQQPPADGGDAPDERAVAPSDDPDASESAASKVPLDEIKRYVGVYNAIKQAYVDPVDDKTLMTSAIRGLLLDLDPHSAYLQKEDAEAFDQDTSGAYDGIGVEVQQLPDGTVTIIAPIDGTPAARAGIKSGDVIVAVDGKPLTPATAAGQSPLRGNSGSSVKLTIVRQGVGKPLDFDLMRETIRVASVRGRLLEPGYAYVRVSAFQADTAADFEKTLNGLQGQASNKLKGLVLDLRSNPGGLLTSAVQIADDLLESGKIVSTRGRVPISDAVFSATPGDLMHGAPVMVLVDAGSASASEVLAGALHDNRRARVIGSRTFGKGSVQTVLPLDNGDSVKLTTARYYTPSGKSIQARGIEPDVVLKPDDPANSRVDYAESMLPGHLLGDDEVAGSNAGDVLEGDKPIADALMELKQPGSVAKAAATAAPAKKPAPVVNDAPASAASKPATPVEPAAQKPVPPAKDAPASDAPKQPATPSTPAPAPTVETPVSAPKPDATPAKPASAKPPMPPDEPAPTPDPQR